MEHSKKSLPASALSLSLCVIRIIRKGIPLKTAR